MINRQEVLPKMSSNILLNLSVFCSLPSVYFQITTHKYSVVARAMKSSYTSTGNDDYFIYEDINVGGNMPAKNRGEASYPIENNKNKNKEKNNKWGIQLSLIGAGMENVDKAPLL